MASEVSIIISAKDQASKAFGGIGKAIGGLGKLALGAAVGGIAALGAGLAFSVKAAMEAEEIQAQLAAVLKSTNGAAGMTADSVNDLALKLSKVTRFEDDAIVAGENMLLTFTNIGKDVFPQATETILNMSTALGQDLQSSAIQLGKALNDPITGVTALQRVGVKFTEEQKNMISAMVESGDVMGAQKLILQELETEFGGSAEAAGQTFAGQLDILKNSMGNVAEEVGAAFLPALTGITQSLVPIVEEYGPKVAAWLGENIPKAIEAVSTWVNGTLVPALTAVWAFIQDNLIPIFSQVVTWLQANIPTAISTVSDFWTNTLQPALSAVWEFIQNNVIPIFETIASKLNAEMPGAIQTLVEWWNGTLKPALEALWTFLSEDMKPIWEALGNLIGVTIVLAFELLKAAWENVLKPAFDAIWKLIQDYVLPAFESISENETLQKWIDTIAGAIGWLITQLQTAVEWFQNLGKAKANSDEKGVTAPGGTGGKGPRQFGGPVFAGQPYMVGERGPELFVPNGSGQVVNNWNLTINEAGNRGNVVMDFEIMKALARA